MGAETTYRAGCPILSDEVGDRPGQRLVVQDEDDRLVVEGQRETEGQCWDGYDGSSLLAIRFKPWVSLVVAERLDPGPPESCAAKNSSKAVLLPRANIPAGQFAGRSPRTAGHGDA